jgi:hypothetical protein
MVGSERVRGCRRRWNGRDAASAESGAAAGSRALASGACCGSHCPMAALPSPPLGRCGGAEPGGALGRRGVRRSTGPAQPQRSSGGLTDYQRAGVRPHRREKRSAVATRGADSTRHGARSVAVPTVGTHSGERGVWLCASKRALRPSRGGSVAGEPIAGVAQRLSLASVNPTTLRPPPPPANAECGVEGWLAASPGGRRSWSAGLTACRGSGRAA